MLKPIGPSTRFRVTEESIGEGGSSYASHEPHRDVANLQAKEERNQITNEGRAQDVLPVSDDNTKPNHRQVDVWPHRSNSHNAPFLWDPDQPVAAG